MSIKIGIVGIPSKPNPNGGLWIPEGSKIAFLGGHVDDIEIGAGSTISDFSQHAHILQVYYCVMTTHNEERKKEAIAAIDKLGLEDNALLFEFPDGEFRENRPQIVSALWDIKHTIQPDIVFTHAASDNHPDHQVIGEESYRVFREEMLLTFRIPKPYVPPEVWSPNVFHELDDSAIQRKLDLLSVFRTQAGKDYVKPARVISYLEEYGNYCGVEFAEAFRALKILI